MEVLLLILALPLLAVLIAQPKCPRCKSKSVVLYSKAYKCTKCGEGFDNE